MTVAERTLTLNILSELSDVNLANVTAYAKRVLARQQKEEFFQPLSESELLAKLDHSYNQAKTGQTISAKVVRERERTRYGI
ncbi:hypothetical protein IJ103_01245 [Candidatus Saccharibacteria bacterium]|nr:hypothetical protein [Candidatus Saccharibacteria bacterium]MBQ9016859.1 hypothetical protein [Candidatus Saccharibacteria bacterium]